MLLFKERLLANLRHLGLAVGLVSVVVMPVHAELLDVEKDELKFGFIKLTDMAPLAARWTR